MRYLLKDSGKTVLQSALDARRLLPFAFILMLAFLVAMAWDSFSRTRELLSSQAYVEHTHQVLYELDAIQDGLGDAREAWLHYILTPEKQDLDTFDDSYKEVWKRVARVEDLSKDDPAQSGTNQAASGLDCRGTTTAARQLAHQQDAVDLSQSGNGF